MTTNYGISDGDGNLICEGIQHVERYRIAQRIADERGESVFLWEEGPLPEDDDEAEPAQEEVKPACAIEITTSVITPHDAVVGTWKGDRDLAASAAASVIQRRHGLSAFEEDIQVGDDGTWTLPAYVDGEEAE